MREPYTQHAGIQYNTHGFDLVQFVWLFVLVDILLAFFQLHLAAATAMCHTTSVGASMREPYTQHAVS